MPRNMPGGSFESLRHLADEHVGRGQPRVLGNDVLAKTTGTISGAAGGGAGRSTTGGLCKAWRTTYAATRPSTIAITPKVTVAGLIRFTSNSPDRYGCRLSDRLRVSSG